LLRDLIGHAELIKRCRFAGAKIGLVQSSKWIKVDSMCACIRAILQCGIFALVASCMAGDGFAQSKEPRFDVVSIKPLGPKGGPAPFTGELILPGGMFRDPGTTLRYLIATAYDIEDAASTVIDLPKWAEAAGYAITAKAGPDYPAVTAKQNQENVKEMLRSMLADRFRLKIHQEQRKTKVLVLQVKEGGAKLQPTSAPVPPEKEGRLGMGLGDRGGSFSGKKVTIAQLARLVGLFLKERVEDRTGLTGFYDFNESWKAPYRDGDPVPSDTLGPEGLAELVSYLDQKLRLILKPEMAPAQFWVVDHVEMPDAN
jgi:uncharacterized protein (TIGR03435 family)